MYDIYIYKRSLTDWNDQDVSQFPSYNVHGMQHQHVDGMSASL